MIIGDVMDQIGQQLDTIDGLRVKDYDPDEIQVPCGIVSLPTGDIDYLRQYVRGADSLQINVIILVAADGDRKRRDLITSYADGSGPKSIKQVLERGSYTAFETIAVQKARFAFLTYNRIKYLGIMFTCMIMGKGE